MEFWKVVIITILYKINFSKSEIGYKEDLSLTPIPTPVSFTSPDAVLRLIPWDFVKYSKLELQFSTREPTGIIFFLGSASASHGCVGLELFNYNLYGFGQMLTKEFRIQLNPTNVPVSSGIFHKVIIQMESSNYLSMQLDQFPMPDKILVPGKLEFDSYTYVGGIDSPGRLPWQAYSHHGFSGCINYIRVNDEQFVDVLQYSKLTDIRGTQTGVCQTTVARCVPGVCGPGKCYERSYNLLDNMKNFYCDCAGTSKSYSFTAVDILRGETCSIDAPTFTCNSKSYIRYVFEREKITHHDEISLDFKTTNTNEPLFIMKAGSGEKIKTYLSAEVKMGRVFLEMSLYEKQNFKSSFNSKKLNLNDDQWHTLKILRYGENIEMYVDEKDNIVRGSHHIFENHEKFFNRVKEIFLGSITRTTGNDKCIGQLRNFYWNGQDLMGKRKQPNQYSSKVVTDKPVLPILPLFPRQPPRPCTITPNHQYTLLNTIPLTVTNGIFVIEFKTKFDGIVWHAATPYSSNVWMTLLVHANTIGFAYSFQFIQGIQIIEVARGGLTIRDNTWHRVIVDLNKSKGIIYLHIDNAETLGTEIQLPGLQNQLANVNNLVFSIGGIQDDLIYQYFVNLLQQNAVGIAKDFTSKNETFFVGCVGDLLVNSNNFTKNILKQEMLTFPTGTMICRACNENMVKCPKNYCRNNGKCFNVNDERISCDCQGTGFYGNYCEIKSPTCYPNPCLNGGLCQIVSNNRICNCTGTGFVGLECEISRCQNFKCLNYGICKIVRGLPECDCSSTMYSGVYCEIPKCPINFCQNNGQCRMNQLTQRPFCMCNGTGHMGIMCEQSICTPFRCNGNGQCVVNNDNAVCYCNNEFMGDRCEKPICPVGHCLNEGSCRVFNKQPLCTCLAYYYGSRCELTKPCPVGHCLYGGQCQIIKNVPTCNCAFTDYEGARCEKPKNCPAKYCENGGKCSVVSSNFVCNCLNTGFSGDRCTNKIECPVGFCQNGGICGITNGKFTCDCSLTAYSGDVCNTKSNGILCDYKKASYTITPFEPHIKSEGLTTSVGFQTFVKTGTLFCFETMGEKYWSIKLMDGKPVVDINGMLFYMKTVVNDGQYHLIRISRDSVNFVFTLGNPVLENLIIPTQMTSILKSPNNVITYTKLTLCNSCPETSGQDRFQGTINNMRFGAQYISDQIKNGVGVKIGPVQNILAPMNPLPPIPATIPCMSSYCKNGGICTIKNYGPFCDCGLSGYSGDRCENRIFVIKSVPPTPGYVVSNVLPLMARSLDMMQFLAQWSESSSPIMTWINDKGDYLEMSMKNGMIYFNVNDKLLGPINKQKLELNVPHFFRSKNLLGRVTMYVNGSVIGHTHLTEPLLMTNGSIRLARVIIGANNKRTETIKGFLGDYQHNGFRLLEANGSLAPSAVRVHKIVIEPWIKTKRFLPGPVSIKIGNHGGVVFKPQSSGLSSLIMSEGFGAGAIISVAAGPVILGAQVFGIGGGSVNPLLLGLILAFLLLVVALIWACGALIFRIAGKSSSKGRVLGGASGSFKAVPLLSRDGMGLSSAKDESDFAAISTLSNRHQLNNGADIGLVTVNGNLSGGNKTNDLYLTSASTNLVASSNLTGMNKSLFGTSEYNNMLQTSKEIDNFHSMKSKNNFKWQEDHSFNTMRQSNVFGESELKLDCCLMTNNSKFAVTGSIFGPPQVWDLNDGSLVHIMDGENQACTYLHLAVDDTIVIGLVSDKQLPSHLKTLKMWHFPQGQIIEFEHEILCTVCCVIEDGVSIVIGENMKAQSLMVLNLITGTRRRLFYDKPESESTDGIQLLKSSKSGRFVIAGYQAVNSLSYYMVFDINKPNMEYVGLIKMKSHLQCCDLINGNEAVIGTSKGELIVWDLLSMQVVRQIAPNPTFSPHEGPINCLSVSEDQSILVTGGSDSWVKVWTMDNENLLHSWNKHEDEITSLAISNDNEIIASGSADGSIRVWNTTIGQELCSFNSNIEINKVLLSPDKKVIVGLGERSGVNKLVMLKILRNVHQVKRNVNTTEVFPSPTL